MAVRASQFMLTRNSYLVNDYYCVVLVSKLVRSNYGEIPRPPRERTRNDYPGRIVNSNGAVAPRRDPSRDARSGRLSWPDSRFRMPSGSTFEMEDRYLASLCKALP